MSYHDFRKAPIVSRVPDMTGYRTLYARFMTRMPVTRNGADGTPRPWNSGFQPLDQGPIRNGLFNDALFRAGYPGYNLGLSYKVQTLDTTNAGSGMISPNPPLDTPRNAKIRNPTLMRRRS